MYTHIYIYKVLKVLLLEPGSSYKPLQIKLYMVRQVNIPEIKNPTYSITIYSTSSTI